MSEKEGGRIVLPADRGVIYINLSGWNVQGGSVVQGREIPAELPNHERKSLPVNDEVELIVQEPAIELAPPPTDEEPVKAASGQSKIERELAQLVENLQREVNDLRKQLQAKSEVERKTAVEAPVTPEDQEGVSAAELFSTKVPKVVPQTPIEEDDGWHYHQTSGIAINLPARSQRQIQLKLQSPAKSCFFEPEDIIPMTEKASEKFERECLPGTNIVILGEDSLSPGIWKIWRDKEFVRIEVSLQEVETEDQESRTSKTSSKLETSLGQNPPQEVIEVSGGTELEIAPAETEDPPQEKAEEGVRPEGRESFQERTTSSPQILETSTIEDSVVSNGNLDSTKEEDSESDSTPEKITEDAEETESEPYPAPVLIEENKNEGWIKFELPVTGANYHVEPVKLVESTRKLKGSKKPLAARCERNRKQVTIYYHQKLYPGIWKIFVDGGDAIEFEVPIPK